MSTLQLNEVLLATFMFAGIVLLVWLTKLLFVYVYSASISTQQLERMDFLSKLGLALIGAGYIVALLSSTIPTIKVVVMCILCITLLLTTWVSKYTREPIFVYYGSHITLQGVILVLIYVEYWGAR